MERDEAFAARVKYLRREHGHSLATAKKVAVGEQLEKDARGATSLDDLRRVMLDMIEDLYPQKDD